MTMYLVIQENESCTAKIRDILFHSVSWGGGYFGMWAAKWLAASAILHKNVIEDAIHQALIRLSGSASGYSFTCLDVISRSLSTAFGNAKPLALIIFLAALLYGLWRCRFQLKQFLLHAAPYLLVCLMPFAWYGVLRNHSFVHPFFTYRSLVVFVFAFLSMAFSTPRDAKPYSKKEHLLP